MNSLNFEFFGYFAAILTTAAFLPQLIKTLKSKKADDVSRQRSPADSRDPPGRTLPNPRAPLLPSKKKVYKIFKFKNFFLWPSSG